MSKQEREKFPGEEVLATTAEKVEVIGSKTYYVIKDNDPTWKVFNKGYENSEFYSLCKEAGARFKIQFVYPYVGKDVFARICKASPNLRIHGEVDYIIEISGMSWEMFDDNIRTILMSHEITHIAATMDEEGNIKFELRDHDVQDFLWLIKKYGVEWCELSKTMKDSVAAQLEKIKEEKKSAKASIRGKKKRG